MNESIAVMLTLKGGEFCTPIAGVPVAAGALYPDDLVPVTILVVA